MNAINRMQENYDAQEHPDYWLDIYEPDEDDEPEHEDDMYDWSHWSADGYDWRIAWEGDNDTNYTSV